MDRIYLDLCCLKRPFDDPQQQRVRHEALAVTSIVEQAERGAALLVRSPALLLENDANPREDRRIAAALWLNGAAVDVPHTENVAERARALLALGFRVMDGLHLAYAEAARARWFVTCDDELLRTARTNSAALQVAVVNPTELVLKANE